ncbi:urease accessory protein UreD [Pannus brasiliensis CCIBt3594]|uniref:Urease accessory protein UreD n=1 Tax=Pannus brasiliensis CCIBt3594 TaxID=1427578 RepID=A0AAW9R034_9CHRO
MWRGSVALDYSYQQQRTRIDRAFAVAPFKVQRPFYPEGDAVCHTVILHTAGGIVGGDLLDTRIHLQPSSNALITTASASKLYRSNGQTARQSIEVKIEAGASLEWLPQESIVFDGARFQQDMKIELAPDASWLGWEITRFGRSARGERFLSGEWRSNLEIWREGKPLWIDRAFLPGGDAIEGYAGLNGKAIVGTLLYIGKPVPEIIIEKIRDFSPIGEMGVTRTLGDGILCRYRGDSTAEVRGWFVAIWHLLRGEMTGRGSIVPRVWLSW